MRRSSPGAGALLAALAAGPAGACRRAPPPVPATDGAPEVVRAGAAGAVVARPDAAPVAPAVARFEPEWACRVTGPGRFGLRPQVSVPPPRPGAPRGTIADSVPLRDGGRLHREVVTEQGQPLLARGRVRRTGPRDAGLGDRTYDVVAGAVEMLFEDDRGAGVAFLTPAGRIVALRIGTGDEPETLVERVDDPTRPCAGPVTDPLRMWPVAPRPWAFPSITGIPPSVADARWTLSRDQAGVCVARLEGEGPWGRVFVEAGASGLRGDLSLAESLNPVTCGPAAAMAASDGGARR